jgi:hypothetical protein
VSNEKHYQLNYLRRAGTLIASCALTVAVFCGGSTAAITDQAAQHNCQ